MFICLAVSLLCIQLLLSRSSHRILQDGVCDVCCVCVCDGEERWTCKPSYERQMAGGDAHVEKKGRNICKQRTNT